MDALQVIYSMEVVAGLAFIRLGKLSSEQSIFLKSTSRDKRIEV